MSNPENIFNINQVLKHLYQSQKEMLSQTNNTLIFKMGKTIPRKLKGNDVALEQLLSTLLHFILQHTKNHEILLSLEAPDDFLYEEDISFKILKTDIQKEKLLAFLETGLGHNMKTLEAKIVYESNVDIHLDIPFLISELGYRRHYRLPKKSMLNKKVLMISESENVTQSITTMLKYFPYDVDVAFKEFKEEKTHLVLYDLIIMESKLITESFLQILKEIKETKNIRFVLLGNEDINHSVNSVVISTHLMQPVTQESIFELLISVFEYESDMPSKEQVPFMEIKEEKMPQSPLDTAEPTSALQDIIEQKKSGYTLVLNKKVGLDNAKKQGTLYADELNLFLDTFERSDLYFRQIVNEKQSTKIKDFCIDLEKQSKLIGAENLQKFADIVSLIFVYDKLDMLPIYPGRYHIELEKLLTEIKKYLGYL